MSVKASVDIPLPFQQMLFCVPTLGQALLRADSWWRKQTIGKQIDSISGKCVKQRETVRQRRYKQRSYVTGVQHHIFAPRIQNQFINICREKMSANRMIEMTEQSSHTNRQETAKQLEIFIVNGIARPGEFCKGEFCKGNEEENIAIKVQMPCEDRK